MAKESTSTSPARWAIRLVHYLTPDPNVKVGRFRSALDPKKILGTVCLFVCAFLWSPFPAVFAITVIGLTTLLIRDWIIYPAEGTVQEAAFDGFWVFIAVFWSQLHFAHTDPIFATEHASDLFIGLGRAILMIASWRIFSHITTLKNDAKKLPQYRIFRAAFAANMLCGLAFLLVLGSSIMAVPGGHLRDAVLGFVIPFTGSLAQRLAMDSGHWIFWEVAGCFTIFTDPIELELEARSQFLPQPGKDMFKKAPASAKFLTMFALALVTPWFLAMWRVFFGDPSTILWGRLTGNLITLVVLLVMWSVILEFNKATSQLFREEAERRRKNRWTPRKLLEGC